MIESQATKPVPLLSKSLVRGCRGHPAGLKTRHDNNNGNNNNDNNNNDNNNNDNSNNDNNNNDNNDNDNSNNDNNTNIYTGPCLSLEPTSGGQEWLLQLGQCWSPTSRPG